MGWGVCFRMCSVGGVKLRCEAHLNASWASVQSECLADRAAAARLYARLAAGHELITLPPPALPLRTPALRDFDQDAVGDAELFHHQAALLCSQASLARAVWANSGFARVLNRRLAVVQRVLHALGAGHEGGAGEAGGCVAVARPAPERRGAGTAPAGADGLVELGVKTGLSLVFTLLCQRGDATSALCCDVLLTALDVVHALPPLSLANEAKLPLLGLDVLGRVSVFLRGLSLQAADLRTKRLATELALALAAQRGSLRYLLDWIDTAMNSAIATRQHDAHAITHELFVNILERIACSAVRLVVTLQRFHIQSDFLLF